MNIRYAKFFEIRCLHLYYKGRNSSDLRLVPTAPTQRMLSKFRLIVRRLADGIIVLAPVEGSPAKLQVPIGLLEGFKLVFRVELANPFFLNFTELSFVKLAIPFLKPLKIGYYFSNLNNNQHNLTNPDQALKLLSKKTGSPTSNEDRLPFWTQALRVHNDPANNQLEYKIKNGDDVEVFSENVSTADPFSEYAPEKPPRLAAGIYKLSVDGGADQQVYIDDELYHNTPFGVVEIYHNAAVHNNYKFLQTETVDVPVFQSYQLLFDARSTIWRYHFPNGLNGITAIAKGTTQFTKNESEKMYEAPNAIKMTDEYQSVQITRPSGSKSIPNPSIKSVVPQKGSTVVYADIYM